MGKRKENILGLIWDYAGIDGAHHKQWLLDQIVRELTGKEYEEWVRNWEVGDDGPETYKWDTGIAP